MNQPTYRITYAGSSEDLAMLRPGQQIQVTPQPSSISSGLFTIEAVRKVGFFDNFREDFYKLAAAIKVPFGKTASARAFSGTLLIYLALLASGVSSFFMRGWRFRLVQNMLPSRGEPFIGPSLRNVDDIGGMIRDGMKLVLAKFFFDIPKVFILTVWGFSHFEAVAQWIIFILSRILGSTDQTLAGLIDETIGSTIVSSGLYLVFLLATTFFISPVFKIHEIRYAAGKIEFRDFFRFTAIKDSYRIYRANRVSTIEKYAWGWTLGLVSWIIGSILFILLPFLSFLIHPIYKLFFKHWPKAYNYGLLAEKLEKNGFI